MNEELFRAILAMDVYNRGYEPGVTMSGSKIGNATVQNDDNLPVGSQDASFYAAAYNYSGETVISFRGTHDIPLDLTYGYGLGAGVPLVEQAIPAKQFYENVASGDLVGNNNLSFI